jgi:uncharacterized protein
LLPRRPPFRGGPGPLPGRAASIPGQNAVPRRLTATGDASDAHDVLAMDLAETCPAPVASSRCSGRGGPSAGSTAAPDIIVARIPRQPRAGLLMPHASRTLRRLASGLVFLLLAAGPAAAAVPGSHRQAALDLLELTGVREAFHGGFTEGLEQSLRGTPHMAPYREVFTEFVGRHLSWDEVRDWMVGRLVERFSEAELRELLVFYRSPLYRKMEVELEKMIADGPAFTENLLAKHNDELQAMMQARRGEIARDSAKARNRSAAAEQTDLLRLACTRLDAKNNG